MTDKPRRRWTFSLRTLFIVVTLLACWLGWQSKTSRDREAARQWIASQRGVIFHGETYRLLFTDDRLESDIWLPTSFSDAEISRVRRAFPEASVSFHFEDGIFSGAYEYPWVFRGGMSITDESRY